MSLIRGLSPKRDYAKFMIEKRHPATGKAIEKIRVTGADKAQYEKWRRNISLSNSEMKEGYSWEIVPCSLIGAHRISFGFKRN